MRNPRARSAAPSVTCQDGMLLTRSASAVTAGGRSRPARAHAGAAAVIGWAEADRERIRRRGIVGIRSVPGRLLVGTRRPPVEPVPRRPGTLAGTQTPDRSPARGDDDDGQQGQTEHAYRRDQEAGDRVVGQAVGSRSGRGRRWWRARDLERRLGLRAGPALRQRAGRRRTRPEALRSGRAPAPPASRSRTRPRRARGPPGTPRRRRRRRA